MKKAIIGKKIGMTQIFDESGRVVPVTVIEAGPCVVAQKKTDAKEGYTSVQLGFEDTLARKLSKPEKGHLEKNGLGYVKVLHEFKLDNSESLNIGDVLKADVFAEGDKVDVTGISKGKGFFRRHQALGRTPHTHDPRRRAGSSSRRFHGFKHRPLPHPSRQDRRRPYGRGAGDGAEPRRGKSRSGTEYARHPRRHTRPEGQHCGYKEHS